MEADPQIYVAREVLRNAQEALDAIALGGRDHVATDAEEDIIEAARRAWEDYLRLVERRFGQGS